MTARWWRILAALILAAGTAFGLAATGTAHAATPVPAPAALANEGLVTEFSPSTLVSSAWNPTNQPGGCTTANNSAHLNSAGWAEIDTSGATNDCRTMQSPAATLLPTKPGTTYEALMNFSSFQDWPAFWMYGPSWPNQGEIDAVEGGPGASFVTWHQAGNHTIGPDSWDDQTVPYAGMSHDIQPGTWTTVDISFTTTGVDVYYNGSLYVHIPETVTTGGSDPMYLAISEGSCSVNGNNVCNGGTSPAGSVQTQWLREFSDTVAGGGGGTGGPTITLSQGSSKAVSSTSENVFWDQSDASWEKLTVNGPGFTNVVSHVNVTANPGEGSFTGLSTGHTYVVTLQPEATQGGATEGSPGKVTFISGQSNGTTTPFPFPTPTPTPTPTDTTPTPTPTPTPTDTVTPPPVTTRSQYQWPFSWDSFWNMPLASTATYTPVTITDNGTYEDASSQTYNDTNTSDPVKTLTNARLASGSTGPVQVHVDPSMTANGQWNTCSSWLSSADSDTVYQGQTTQLTAGGNPSFGGTADNTWPTVSIKGIGQAGCMGGSGLSGLGGTLTKADVTGTSPITHALKVALDGFVNYSTANGGHRWPALNADGGYNQSGNGNFYGGSDPNMVEGTLLALPPTISPSSFSNPLVQKIAQAAQDYGVYTVDTTATDRFAFSTFITNYDATSSFDTAACTTGCTHPSSNQSIYASQLDTLLKDLAAVTNNTQATPGGGAIGASRCAPYAPPFTDGSDAPPAVTVAAC